MTPDSLYAALDCENADVDLILGQIADWHEERGDCWRAECLQWCRREGKRPEVHTAQATWWAPHMRPWVPPSSVLPDNLHDEESCWKVCDRESDAYANIADAWHALRTRGEVPVAGMDSERMVRT